MVSTAAYFRRTVLPRPFATGAGNVRTDIGQDNTAPLNYLDGFKSVYEQPIASSGRFVTRGDMNAIGNLATQSQFYFQAGGVNSFDQAFAHAIGGYPNGAVLDFLVGTRLYKVVSLRDNNLVDFTGATPQFADIEEGRVDDVNWAYANTNDADTSNVSVGKLPSTLPMSGSSMVTAFIAPKDGLVSFRGDFKVAGKLYFDAIEWWYGAGLFIREYDPADEPIAAPTWKGDYNGWTPVYSFVRLGYSEGSTGPFHDIDTQVFSVQTGKKYCIASASGAWHLEGSSDNGQVYDVDMDILIV